MSDGSGKDNLFLSVSFILFVFSLNVFIEALAVTF